MSILVWNCRGMVNPRAVRFLREIVHQQRPSFFFLPETLIRKNKIEAICKVIHFAGCYVIDVHGHEGGLALM